MRLKEKCKAHDKRDTTMYLARLIFEQLRSATIVHNGTFVFT